MSLLSGIEILHQEIREKEKLIDGMTMIAAIDREMVEYTEMCEKLKAVLECCSHEEVLTLLLEAWELDC